MRAGTDIEGDLELARLRVQDAAGRVLCWNWRQQKRHGDEQRLWDLVQRSVAVFTVVKLAGALYLVWLGIQAIRRRKALASAFAGAAEARGGRRAAREGFIVGVTNPKALILFGAVLPQFVDRAAGHVPVQMLLLSLVSIAIGLVSDSTWA